MSDIQQDQPRFSYGPPQLNLTAESEERAQELETALEWKDTIAFLETEAAELHGPAKEDYLRQAQELRALVTRIEAGPRDLSPGHAGCTLAMHDDCECEHIGAPPLTTTEKRDPDLETSPAELRRRADAFEARAKAWRSRPDLTREDRFIARGLELTVAALRASEDYLSLSRETVDHVRTAALAANAADVVRNTQDLQPQQHDRHVVRITAAATGAGRDRHGRAFQVAGAEPNGARLYDACRVLELQTGIERQSIRNMVESSGRTVNDGDSAQLANVEPSLSVSRGMRR